MGQIDPEGHLCRHRDGMTAGKGRPVCGPRLEEEKHRDAHQGNGGVIVVIKGLGQHTPLLGEPGRARDGAHSAQNTQPIERVPRLAAQRIGPQVVAQDVIAHIPHHKMKIQVVDPQADRLAGTETEHIGQQPGKDEHQSEKPVKFRPAGAPHEGAQNGGDQIEADDHVEKPQVEMGLAQRHLIEGVPQVGHMEPMGEDLSGQGVGGAPHHQRHENTENMAAQQLGQGKGMVRVQQEHTGEHHEDRHAPVREAVIDVEDVKGKRAYRHVFQLRTGQMEHDDGRHGGTAQQVGVGKPALVG